MQWISGFFWHQNIMFTKHQHRAMTFYLQLIHLDILEFTLSQTLIAQYLPLETHIPMDAVRNLLNLQQCSDPDASSNVYISIPGSVRGMDQTPVKVAIVQSLQPIHAKRTGFSYRDKPITGCSQTPPKVTTVH